MPPLGIARLDKYPRFKRAYKKLPEVIQREVDETIKDLFKEVIPPGRKVKKDKADRSVWTARVNDDYRLSFEINGDIAIFRNVAKHDKLYECP